MSDEQREPSAGEGIVRPGPVDEAAGAEATPDERMEGGVAPGSDSEGRNPLDDVHAATDAQDGERQSSAAKRGSMSTDLSGSDVADLPPEHN